MKRLLVVLICLVVLSCGACRAATIWVKAGAPWSVTGKDDLAQLKRLASGVGWEFEANPDTNAGLKKIGIKTIRCINVDPLPGKFDDKGKFTVGEPGYLLAHFDTCRAVGANPHVIVAVGMHPELRVTEKDAQGQTESIMGMIHEGIYGPNDWSRFRNYCYAYFEYVLITQGFPKAEFEVSNEPDIGGVVYPMPPRPTNGSRLLYEAYFNLYKNVAEAAESFEKDHPGMKVRLGGPAIAWAYTFKFGDFNWAERFVRDCGEQKVKLDFIGLHYYGNQSSLDDEYWSIYPSFSQMYRVTKAARDKYCPSAPIAFTEWGPSYITNNTLPSSVNANHIGAAWSAAFLNLMLQCGVDQALYLVTSDLREQGKDGWDDVWGWPSLFTNRIATGKSYPKAIYHVFDMVNRMQGHRVEATRGSDTVNCIVSADKSKKTITALVWNYGALIPEGGPVVEKAKRDWVGLQVRDAGDFFGSKSVKVQRWLIGANWSDAYSAFKNGAKLNDRNTALRQVENTAKPITEGALNTGFSMTPSSVTFVVMSAGK